MKFAIITDAWSPQVNGVAHTLSHMSKMANTKGHEVLVVQPNEHPTMPLPSYPEIRLSLTPWKMIKQLKEFEPEAIHIATEGSLGTFARWWLGKQKIPFTTSYHTRFPEYVRERVAIPLEWGYKYMRWFHQKSERVLVPTSTIQGVLETWNLNQNITIWDRGVNRELFHPHDNVLEFGPRPVSLYAGRVSVEKNIEAFLQLELPGTKVVVGDGPAKAQLEQQYPDVVWQGYKFGKELAHHYASADVFVFPSLTDTFGNVLLEAMASGTPIAAFHAPGPKDVLEVGINGILSADLQNATLAALELDRSQVYESSFRWSWDRSFQTFLGALSRFPRPFTEMLDKTGVPVPT